MTAPASLTPGAWWFVSTFTRGDRFAAQSFTVACDDCVPADIDYLVLLRLDEAELHVLHHDAVRCNGCGDLVTP